MKRDFTIEVTQEDIDHGERMDCAGCPIALAVNRATGRRSMIGGRFSNYICAGSNIHFELPDEAIAFASRFDRRSPVAPFSFKLTLDLPEAA